MRHLKNIWSDLGHPFMLRSYCLILIAAFILLKIGKCNAQGDYVILYFHQDEVELGKLQKEIIVDIAESYDVDSIIGYAGAVDNMPGYACEQFAKARAFGVDYVLEDYPGSHLIAWRFNPANHYPEAHQVRIHYSPRRMHYAAPKNAKQYKAAFKAFEEHIMQPYYDVINSNLVEQYLRADRGIKEAQVFLVDYFRVPYFRDSEEYKAYYANPKNNFLLSVEYKVLNGVQ